MGRRARRQDPRMREEWLKRAELTLVLSLDATRQYGLTTGGPEIDQDRGAEILRLAMRRGIKAASLGRG